MLNGKIHYKSPFSIAMLVYHSGIAQIGDVDVKRAPDSWDDETTEILKNRPRNHFVNGWYTSIHHSQMVGLWQWLSHITTEFCLTGIFVIMGIYRDTHLQCGMWA